jgi:hypothetical protein
MTAPLRIFANLAVDPIMSCLQPSLNIPLSGGLVEVSNHLTRRFFVTRFLCAEAAKTGFVPAGKPATNRRSSRYVPPRLGYHDIPMKIRP